MIQHQACGGDWSSTSDPCKGSSYFWQRLSLTWCQTIQDLKRMKKRTSKDGVYGDKLELFMSKSFRTQPMIGVFLKLDAEDKWYGRCCPHSPRLSV
eukprot:3154059-Amphidinium_carterae.1